MSDVEIINVPESNIGEFGLCGARNAKHEGYRRKADWLRKRLSEGLKYKILYSIADKDVGFIEYAPGEINWRAINAPGYMVVHCMAIFNNDYKGKGLGIRLLDACIEDAREQEMMGVASVTGDDTWIHSKDIFVNTGFDLVARAPQSFQLVAKQFKDGPLPSFPDDWEARIESYGPELTILRSDQCPAIAKSVRDIVEAAEDLGIETNVIEVETSQDAQNAPSPSGTFNMIYQGKLLTDHAISKTRFLNIINELKK